ncbi:MAG: hypothetical protein D3917_08805 [Candidatus Electrothrix sp. AX5]|nr:hypothetical protein [Candidatus Electrothrix sp. AX5]
MPFRTPGEFEGKLAQEREKKPSSLSYLLLVANIPYFLLFFMTNQNVNFSQESLTKNARNISWIFLPAVGT